MNKLILITTILISTHVSGQSIPVQFNHGGCNINAILDLPPGNGPHPAIVMIPGSGQNDRNGTTSISGANGACLYPGLIGQTLRPLRDMAHQLRDSGYAVLRYDEIMISCPNYQGPFNFNNVFLPANSALDFLKTRSDIDTNKLILAGHSEGAMLIAAIARQRSDVKALISLAGGRTPLDTAIARQLVEIADSCGGDTSAAKQAGDQYLQYFQLVRQQNFSVLPNFGGLPPQEWYPYINHYDSVAIIFDMINLPTLFVAGELDFNVPPSELFRFQQETTMGFDFYLLEDLNHQFTPPNIPSVQQAVGDTLVHWLRNFNLKSKSFEEAVYAIYPNPVENTLFIRDKNTVSTKKTWQLINTHGKVILTGQTNPGRETEINLASMAKGVYFLRIENGEKTISRKILVK
ncbi:MAG: T9SS type A sorting domain-containing protein [Cryomorphaceae bacterium]|nr:T9SS type A sorting domain-containing protein [Cryomorphaceae bacterium]